MGLYERFKKEKAEGRQFSVNDITADILQILFVEEGLTNGMIAELFSTSDKKIAYRRKKYGITVFEKVKKSILDDVECWNNLK